MKKPLYLIVSLVLSVSAMAQYNSKATLELVGEWRLDDSKGSCKVLLFDSSLNRLIIKNSTDTLYRFTYSFSNNILTLTDGITVTQNKVQYLTYGNLIFSNFLTAEGRQFYYKVERKQVTYQ